MFMRYSMPIADADHGGGQHEEEPNVDGDESRQPGRALRSRTDHARNEVQYWCRVVDNRLPARHDLHHRLSRTPAQPFREQQMVPAGRHHVGVLPPADLGPVSVQREARLDKHPQGEPVVPGLDHEQAGSWRPWRGRHSQRLSSRTLSRMHRHRRPDWGDLERRRRRRRRVGLHGDETLVVSKPFLAVDT